MGTEIEVERVEAAMDRRIGELLAQGLSEKDASERAVDEALAAGAMVFLDDMADTRHPNTGRV